MSNFITRITKHWTLVILFIALSLVQVAILSWSWNATKDVKANAELIEANARETCENRAYGRMVVRKIMFGFINELPPTAETTELIVYIQENYPEIDCQKELAK